MNKTTNDTNVGTKLKKYVVVRGGVRVSETEYNTIGEASGELSHWNNIINRWPDGTKVVVVEKDVRYHRTYNIQ